MSLEGNDIVTTQTCKAVSNQQPFNYFNFKYSHYLLLMSLTLCDPVTATPRQSSLSFTISWSFLKLKTSEEDKEIESNLVLRRHCCSALDVVEQKEKNCLTDKKKNEILPFATARMDLDGIMLSEMHHAEKDKYCMITLIL